MFGFLKDKLKKVISSVSDKLKKKEEPKIEEKEELPAEELKEEKEEKVGPKEEREEKTAEEREEKEETAEEAEGAPAEEEISEEKAEKAETEEEKELAREELEEIEKDIGEIRGQKVEEEKYEVSEEENEQKEKLEKEEKKGFFAKLKEKFQTKMSDEDFNEFFAHLEMALMENSVAMGVIDALKDKLRKELVGKAIRKSEFEKKISEALSNSISSLLIEPFDLIERIKSSGKKPYVIVFLGINGSGKTTTIAKVANLLHDNKLSCVLGAADTFRAASIEQLEVHGKILGVKVIKHKYGADPAAVAFDAIAHAKSSGIDVVLIDTAGRMNNKKDLMKEMEKIIRVAKPDMKIFIGEAITGNDAVEQAKSFDEIAGIDAIILSKADVDEKGGASISVSYITGKPIIYLGTGQEYGDLEKFNKQKIIESLGLV